MHKTELEIKYWIIPGYLGEMSRIHSELKDLEVFTLFQGGMRILMCFKLCLNMQIQNVRVAVELSELLLALTLCPAPLQRSIDSGVYTWSMQH